jgi:hypothetical protein
MKNPIIQTLHPIRFGLAAVLTVLLASSPAYASGDGQKPHILPPDSPAFGKTYGEWSAAWWQWAYSLETIHHPLFNTADVSAGQTGRVWFLGGAFSGTGPVTRNCVIPEGKALFFPILDVVNDNTACPTPTSYTTDELRAVAKGIQDQASGMTCTIDGRSVQGLSDPIHTPYRVQSPVFSYVAPPVNNVLESFGATCYNNPSGIPFTVDGAIADGVFLMVAPLPVGQHTLKFGGTLPPFGLTVDVTYNITVVEEDLGNRGIAAPDSKPYGKSYGEWLAKDWQWVYSLPVNHHPLFDTADVSTGQSGPLWFLGGTYATEQVGTHVTGIAVRHATVPEGKALFVPLVDAESATAEGNGTAEAQLRAASVGLLDHAVNLSCEIDGQPVKNIEKYRSQSPLFTWGPLPANNVFQDAVNFPAGLTSPSVADGYELIIAPLCTGHHTIHYTGAVVFTQAQDGFDFSFSQDITYHLTVMQGHDHKGDDDHHGDHKD